MAINVSYGASTGSGGDYYRAVAAYFLDLPRTGSGPPGLLNSYNRGPGRRPGISLNGDEEDTADVVAEILDVDQTALDSEDGTGSRRDTALSRESPAAFLHDLVSGASAWFAEDAARIDRFAGARSGRRRRIRRACRVDCGLGQRFRAPHRRSAPSPGATHCPDEVARWWPASVTVPERPGLNESTVEHANLETVPIGSARDSRGRRS